MNKWILALLPLLAFAEEDLSMGSASEYPSSEIKDDRFADVIEDFEIDFDYEDDEEDSSF